MVADRGPLPPEYDGHAYIMTIAGRCQRCQQPEVTHVKRLPGGPDPMTGCPIDHATVSTQSMLGNDGLVWTRCPFCRVMIEPAMRDGNVRGPIYGPGRGDLSDRLKKRLDGMAGWWAYNGGDNAG